MRDSSSIGCAIITDEASPVHSDTGVEDPDAASSDSAIPCGDAGMREGGTGTVDAGEGCSEPAACAGTMLGARGLHGRGAARDQGGGSLKSRGEWLTLRSGDGERTGHQDAVPHRVPENSKNVFPSSRQTSTASFLTQCRGYGPPRGETREGHSAGGDRG